MANVIDYVKTRLDTFEERPFCTVDSLALSFLAYITIPDELEPALTWEGMRIGDLYRAEHFESYYKIPWATKSGLELLVAMAASPRFRDIKLARFVEKIDLASEMQFSAMTFIISGAPTYVAYKGTDANLVGWKEDFNLSFQCPVPSQVEAVAYLAEAAEHCEGPLNTGGHSKGGNLSIYATAMCDEAIQARIEHAFSHDGPGFLKEFTETDAYLRVASHIDKTIPQSSVVGMLMEEGPFRVVKSEAIGLWQHDPSTWLVEECDFVWADELATDALYTEATIEKWLHSRTLEERKMFVDALYSVLEEADAETLNDFIEDWRNIIPAVAKALYEMDAETRAFAAQMISDLFVIGAKNVPELLGMHDMPAIKALRDMKDFIIAKKNELAEARP